MENSSLLQLGKIQRIILITISSLLALTLFLMRTGLNSDKPLDFLARSSLPPEVALNNGRPTIIEFYADWCEVCKRMAPSMLSIKEKYKDEIDIVLLNIDNTKWLDLIDKYEVIGIPQLELFDNKGLVKTKLIGLKTIDKIDQFADSLLYNKVLPSNIINKNSSELISPVRGKIVDRNVNPRSHG